jgi:stage II sporulation protein M
VARKKTKNFFTENYRKSWEYIKESKNFIYITLIIFLLFAFIGAFVPVPELLAEQILEFIEELLRKTAGMSQGELISFIFLNNLQSSFFGMIFGIALGIFSVITSILNGYLLGFVSSRAVYEEGIFILWRLLPHGIFELPALLLSTGLGLKLGFPFIYKYFKYYWKRKNIFALLTGIFFLLPAIILTLILNKNLRKYQFKDFLFKVNNSIRVFLFVIFPFLLIAAIIEGSLIFFLK